MIFKVLEGTTCYISSKRSGSISPVLSDLCAQTEFIRDAIVKLDETLTKQNNLSPINVSVGDIQSLIGDNSMKTIVWVKTKDLMKIT